jgi:hypothetical protein
MALYSNMTREQLQEELDRLQKLGQRAFDEENWSEYETLMTKWYLAKSYNLSESLDIKIGRTYRLAEEYDRLTVTKLEGVMAWGIRESTAEEVSVPMALLVEDNIL